MGRFGLILWLDLEFSKPPTSLCSSRPRHTAQTTRCGTLLAERLFIPGLCHPAHMWKHFVFVRVRSFFSRLRRFLLPVPSASPAQFGTPLLRSLPPLAVRRRESEDDTPRHYQPRGPPIPGPCSPIISLWGKPCHQQRRGCLALLFPKTRFSLRFPPSWFFQQHFCCLPQLFVARSEFGSRGQLRTQNTGTHRLSLGFAVPLTTASPGLRNPSSPSTSRALLGKKCPVGSLK